MKKKLITAIIAVVLLIAGCGDKVNVSAGQDRMMEKVEDEWGYAIYVDKDTNVMYIKGSGDGGTFTVMLNADGTPKIWQREE
jgi:protein involved in sex pheromone biosynthesis